MPASQPSWWIRFDSFLGASLCVASLLSLGVILGACICFRRRKASISANEKCAGMIETAESSNIGTPSINCKLLQNMNSLLCNGSLPRHADLPAPPTPLTPHNGTLPYSRNGSAATLPMRYSPTSLPRYEAQLSRSSQCDRELPPVPPPDPSLAPVPTNEVAEEEEDDSQYDLITRAPTSAQLAAAAAIEAAKASAAGAEPILGKSKSSSLPASLPASLVLGRSMASIGGSNEVVVGPGVRTLTSGTIDSDAGSELDPLYACIKPSRQSINRLAAGSVNSTPMHNQREDTQDNQQHVYSFIRKQPQPQPQASPIYQALPRSSHHLSMGRQSLRGSVESYASLGGSHPSHPPCIPDRGYGQSEVDLVERMRRQHMPTGLDSSLNSCGSSPAVVGGLGGGRSRRRSQPGSGVLLRVRGGGIDGRLAAVALEEERRHSQPAMGEVASDDNIIANTSTEAGATPSAAVREASYQRVTVRESIASLRARNALPLSGPASAQAAGQGQQSLSLTDDTSSLYERLDHPSAGNRRSFGPRDREPLLPMNRDPAADFYAEISGDEEAYGEGEVMGIRHSVSGPLRIQPGVAVLPGSGIERVFNEMNDIRHIDSDLDVSQAGTPIAPRRHNSRPTSPLPLPLPRRSLMTPLMERSIEGSLFDDHISHACYSTGSEYERLPQAAPASLARPDSPLLPPAEMTDSGLSVSGSLPVLMHRRGLSQTDSSSGIASRASQSSSMSSGSPPTPAHTPNAGEKLPTSMMSEKAVSRGGRLVTQLLTSIRRKSRPDVRRRTSSDCSSIL